MTPNVRERLAKISLIALLISYCIQLVFSNVFNVHSGTSLIIQAICYFVTFLLAVLGKGLIRLFVFVFLAMAIIPVIVFGTIMGS